MVRNRIVTLGSILPGFRFFVIYLVTVNCIAAQTGKVGLPANGPSLGREDAPVTLVELSGYDCFYCRRHAVQIQPLIVQDYVETGKLRYVVREFPPKDSDSAGFMASEAALCAADQDRYWEMRQELFDHQEELSQALLITIAANLDLDMSRFERCLSEHQYTGVLQRNHAEAKAAGLGSVPGFYIGITDSAGPGRIYPLSRIKGSKGLSAYASVIEALLRQPDGQIRSGSQERTP